MMSVLYTKSDKLQKTGNSFSSQIAPGLGALSGSFWFGQVNGGNRSIACQLVNSDRVCAVYKPVRIDRLTGWLAQTLKGFPETLFQSVAQAGAGGHLVQCSSPKMFQELPKRQRFAFFPYNVRCH